jgi:predicted DNA repair protein MutK
VVAAAVRTSLQVLMAAVAAVLDNVAKATSVAALEAKGLTAD